VAGFDAEGRETTLWTNPRVAPIAGQRRVLRCTAAADVEAKRIRLYVASTAVADWNEIDAVALVDAAGERHWAVSASASSTYADRSRGMLPRASLLAVSPQGDRLVTSGEATQLWDLQSGKLLHRLEPRASDENYPFYPNRAAGYAVAFAPDGKAIAVGTPYNVVLFDAASGAEIRQLPASTAGAAFLRYSPDGRMLTLVNNMFLMRTHPDAPDAWVCPSVQVWDVAAGQLVESVP
jgi:WD40 repeat protein